MDTNDLILLGLLPGAAAGVVVAWLTIRRAPEGAPAAATAQGSESVVIERTKQWTWLGVVLTATPLLGFIRIVREPDPDEALGFFLVTMASIGMGVAFLIYARRKIVFSQDGIESIGLPRFRVPWGHIKTIKGHARGALTNLHFITNDGKKIVIDATMNGWHDLPRLLQELPMADVRTMATRALAELND